MQLHICKIGISPQLHNDMLAEMIRDGSEIRFSLSAFGCSTNGLEHAVNNFQSFINVAKGFCTFGCI